MGTLMTGQTTAAKSFRDNIRSYNSALSFASMGARIEVPEGHGPYVYKIHGTIHHLTSNMHPENGRRSFPQMYVLDSSIAAEERMQISANRNCSALVMKNLDEEIRQINPFAGAFKMMNEYEDQIKHTYGSEAACSVRMYIQDTKPNAEQHSARYNAPRANEIAIVFASSDGAPPSNRDICIHPKGKSLINIHQLNPNCDPMSYVLLFPHGDKGWTTTDRTKYSQLQFYSFRLSVREEFSPIFYAGKLLQQYIVDAYVKVESSRLDYLRNNQKDLRVESYLGLMDHVHSLAAEAGVQAGVPVILPSTFIGSPRAMQQNFQDAMTIVREYGKPSLFITFTCNPKWPEIKSNLLPGQHGNNRPDIVARVFDRKKKNYC
ncbi:uncharacterized protein LOC110861863 [Folsomia candida]|uniref:uncharacterized protein LOC110861863 n=1 Tax=Folsomia candida TaxID=158441 RepID=UPI001604A505|nr:uncharacterized protein LOC110861863 [Folsomia candida]XP_035700916.1 uncharacterized protein LOC110861863 [Folsomia candida]